MTSRERFLTAVRDGVPDRVPLVDWLFSQRLFREVLGVEKVESLQGDLSVRVAREIGHDAVWIPFGGYAGMSDKRGVYQDEWGTTYKKDPAASWPIDSPIDYPIKSPEDLKTYRPPNPDTPERLAEHKKALEEARGELALFGGVPGPFTTAWLLLGYERLSYWVYDHPDKLQDIFRFSNQYYSRAIDMMVDAGMDAIMIAEDLGYTAGLFIHPDQYRTYLFPYLQEIIDVVKQKDVPVILHCDGNINRILDDLVAMGMHALNPIERKAHMDIQHIKQRYGDRICLIGNLDLVRILPHGTEEEVRDHVRELIQTVGRDGGYIVASEHSLNHHIPLRNIMAIKTAVERYG
jgi:uroporphyrinogen decarboxylase